MATVRSYLTTLPLPCFVTLISRHGNLLLRKALQASRLLTESPGRPMSMNISNYLVHVFLVFLPALTLLSQRSKKSAAAPNDYLPTDLMPTNKILDTGSSAGIAVFLSRPLFRRFFFSFFEVVSFLVRWKRPN